MRFCLTLAAMAAVLTTACSADPASGDVNANAPATTPPNTPATTPAPSATSPDVPEADSPPLTLPGGGRSVLPEYRLVGFAGGRSTAFGRLSVDNLATAGGQIDRIAARYARHGRAVMPVFELITVVAHGTPADNGLYRTREPDRVIQQYLDAARANGALLLLNVQPGRAGFLDEVRALERWLREPDVGVALDPEWAVEADEVPGRVYGSTTGAELDSVAVYLSQLVRAHDLPEKVMVFHQVHSSVVTNEDALRPHPGVVLIKSVDGIGDRGSKEATWRTLMRTKPPHVRAGFKLFFEEDVALGPLMTAAEVMALQPTPEYVLYE